MPTSRSFLLTFVLVAAAAGCKSKSSSSSCDLAAPHCDVGLVCVAVDTGGAVCAIPVEIQGHVLALSNDAPIADARVVALDANHAPISAVAITGADGSFTIPIDNPRHSDGSPVAREVLLRADARGYRTFPSGVRQAFPVSTADGALTEGKVYVVSGAETEIKLETVDTGTASIHGTATIPSGSAGVLVVAERLVGGVPVGASALTDVDGNYAIFNLPVDSYTVKAFAHGAVHTPQNVTLVAGQDAEVNIPLSGTTDAAVAGTVQIVNPGNGIGTSVILVVESTFDEKLVRGESPPGLRAPEGLVPDLKGNYTILGVPPGDYVALAAYENDYLVRDPDPCQGGTQIIHFNVPAATGTVTLDGFKVTGSLDVVSPGATTPEVVSGTPVFTWKDDSGEDWYYVSVIDSYGNVLWSTTIPGVSGGANATVTYGQGTVPAPPALSPGYYQFKVTSASNTTCVVNNVTVQKLLSQTEDLKGVFIIQ